MAGYSEKRREFAGPAIQLGLAAFALRLCLIRFSFLISASFGTVNILRNAQSRRSIGVLPCGSGIGIFAFIVHFP